MQLVTWYKSVGKELVGNILAPLIYHTHVSHVSHTCITHMYHTRVSHCVQLVHIMSINLKNPNH